MKKNKAKENRKALKELYQEYTQLTSNGSFVITNETIKDRISREHYKIKTMRAIVSLLRRFNDEYSRRGGSELRLRFVFDNRVRGYCKPHDDLVRHEAVRLFAITYPDNQIVSVYNYRYVDRRVVLEDAQKYTIENGFVGFARDDLCKNYYQNEEWLRSKPYKGGN